MALARTAQEWWAGSSSSRTGAGNRTAEPMLSISAAYSEVSVGGACMNWMLRGEQQRTTGRTL